jgi:hypothetical protein
MKKLPEGPDYLADLGGPVRIVAAIALAPFTLYFALAALLTPVAAVGIVLVEKDWRLAGVVLGAGLFHALLAIPLCWFTIRLFRGTKAANGVTILPTWLIRIFVLCYLGPLLVGLVAAMAVWSFRAGSNGDWIRGLVLAVAGCGLAASLIPALSVVYRLGKRVSTTEPPEQAQHVSRKVD